MNAGLIQRLRRGWGNETYSAPSSFLERIAALARNTGGPILECGSGCSTALLGLLAGSRGVEVWSLEHDPRWLKETETRLRRYRIGGVRLVLAPLRSFGDFTWYDAPAGPPFPDRFTLVVCDGPPSMSTQGGRYGLLPLMGHRFAAGTEILLDDARRPEDRAVIDRWISERPLRMELDEAAGRGIAHLTVA
ncbi:MAG: hypothetical protein ACREMH_02985 [Gemmatimonadales bacterium]